LGKTVDAVTKTYTDVSTGTEVTTHHARLKGLDATTAYSYQVAHDGSDPVAGQFVTAPSGRAPLRFTSFGDQGTGSAQDAVSSPYGSFVVDQVEAQQPLFHLLNGDLCYGNLQPDPAATWGRFFGNL